MPYLDITLDGHLLIAGAEASGLGVNLATIRRSDGRRTVPFLPATALRGAVRIQLEALVRATKGRATGPYPVDSTDTEPKDDIVARLFGYSGPDGERTGSREGCLRFSDALPLDAGRAAAALRVRHGVEIDDLTASVEDRKLFSRELLEVSAEPLVFRSRLDLADNARPEDIVRLRQAVETTFSLGAAKSTGGGEIRIEWVEKMKPIRHRIEGDRDRAARARLALTLLEPAHFGDGGPRGNHHQTQTHLPGATLRGALAWALLRGGTDPEDSAFQALFVGPEAASFGDGLPVSEPQDEPAVLPSTRREPRRGGALEDILVRELVRAELNPRLEGRGVYLRPDLRHLRPDPLPARPAPGLLRRIRTRVSIDRHTGASAEGKLFSIEQIEPWLTTEDESRRVVFVARVEGLTPRTAALLAKIEELPVLVGAGRNHGLGRVELEIRFEPAVDPATEARQAAERISRFEDAVARELAAMAKRVDLDPEVDADLAHLALVARSDFLPTAEIAHPLTAWEELAGPPARSFLITGLCGGYNQRPGGEGQPLKTLRSSLAAGSVFVYRVPRSVLGELLRSSLPALRQGVGERSESGCGRFDLFEETRS